MKFEITVEASHPDYGMNTAIEAAEESLSDLDLSKDEKEKLVEIRARKIQLFLDKWVDDCERFVVEFDTVAGTALVKERLP